MGLFTSALPEYTLGAGYINGLNIGYVGSTALNVTSGVCIDSSNSQNMALPNSITIDVTENGLNGLDTGVLSANAGYYIYLIADSSGFNATGAIVSLNPFKPLMPVGVSLTNYDLIRRIGFWVTDGSSQFKVLRQSGTSNDRNYFYDVPPVILANGISTTFVPVAIAGFASTYPGVILNLYYSYASSPGSNFALRTSVSSDPNGYAQFNAYINALPVKGTVIINSNPTTGFNSIDYKVASGALNLSLLSFTESM